MYVYTNSTTAMECVLYFVFFPALEFSLTKILISSVYLPTTVLKSTKGKTKTKSQSVIVEEEVTGCTLLSLLQHIGSSDKDLISIGHMINGGGQG